MSTSVQPDAIISISDEQTIIDAPTVAYQRIRIHSLVIMGAAAVTLKAGLSTPLTGEMDITANGLVLPFCKEGWFTLPERTAFVIDTDAAIGGSCNWSLLGG